MNYVLANIIRIFVEIFSLLILVEVIGSWLLVMRLNLPAFVFDVLRVVQRITGVILNPLRRIIPSVGGLDLTPIIALFGLQYLGNAIIRALIG